MNVWLQLVAGNILVATLIGGLAWQVGRSGGRAKLAHLLWVAFFVKLITPQIVLLPIHVPESWFAATDTSAVAAIPGGRLVAGPIEGLPSVDSNQSGLATAFSAGDVASHTTWWLPSLNLWTCLGLIWLVGFVVVLGRGLIRFVQFHQLLSREGNHDEEASAFVHQLLNPNSLTRVDTSRGPRVLRIPIRVSPMLFGFGSRPAIVCPDQLWRSLSENDRHAFLAHETAHYHRRDHWVRWLEWVVTAAYWWFPGVYIARHQLERHEEACCDAWAVRQLGSPPRQYAEALLRVVDFISEHNVGIPRLASGMQPTESLEERLRLVMQGHGGENPSSAFRLGAGAACFSLWLVHPVPLPSAPLAVNVESPPTHSVEQPTTIGISPLLPATGANELELPDPPQGFWNETARKQWASFSLRLPGAYLIADSHRGISIEVPQRETLRFSSDELSAIAEVPSTQRVVIGDRVGQLRLWDLSAGMPVSLIGQHATGVTSLAYADPGGLVSADGGGSVMRWDLQSGQVLATWSSKTASRFNAAGDSPAIQSVRFSEDGSMLAILTGRWSLVDTLQEVHFVDSRSLETIGSVEVEPGTAVVVQSATLGWIAINWSGEVRSIETQSVVATVDKHQVSALVLSPASQRLGTNPAVK